MDGADPLTSGLRDTEECRVAAAAAAKASHRYEIACVWGFMGNNGLGIQELFAPDAAAVCRGSVWARAY